LSTLCFGTSRASAFRSTTSGPTNCACCTGWRASIAARIAARLQRLPPGERMFQRCLDEVDVEDLITTLRHDYPGENPMARIDPADPGVANKEDYPGLYPEMNGRKYPHG
jgi:hypothetical protein